jgi:hypothetical protein
MKAKNIPSDCNHIIRIPRLLLFVCAFGGVFCVGISSLLFHFSMQKSDYTLLSLDEADLNILKDFDLYTDFEVLNKLEPAVKGIAHSPLVESHERALNLIQRRIQIWLSLTVEKRQEMYQKYISYQNNMNEKRRLRHNWKTFVELSDQERLIIWERKSYWDGLTTNKRSELKNRLLAQGVNL